MKRIILIIVVVIATAFALLYLSNTPTQQQESINFTESGNLVKNNPGLKPEVWYLVYEAPGSPALSKELQFDDKTMCGTTTCNPATFSQGERVRITGIIQGDTIIVRTVTSL